MIGAIDRTWRRLPVDERARWHGVALCCALYLVHFVLLSSWYIEDAAITFTFARHLADGEGFVVYPGGERVEGFSNPSWTLLLGLTDLVGINPWVAAKLYGAVFGVLTLPLAYGWARQLVGPRGLLPVLAPLLLAVSPQLVIWNASGLENSVLNLCIAASGYLLLREIDRGGFPWSALPLGILAVTRPDAPLYCAVLAGLAVIFALRARGLAAIGWGASLAALSLAPLLAWEAFAWWYFAWPLPNTYYAKLHDMDRFQPFRWTSFSWKYLRGWALMSTWGFLLPLAGPLLTGIRGWRAWIGGAAAVVLVLVLLPGLDWPQAVVSWDEPELLVSVRVWTLLGLALVLPLFGLGRRGDAPRTLAWYLLVAAVFFALYAGGDWMSGHRWLSTAQVPLAVLLPDLLAAVFDRVTTSRGRRVALGLLAGPVVAGSVAYTARYLGDVETSPYDVYQRVRYMKRAQERLHLDHVVNMEVDFGAQMWWTGHELVDMAGLNDVPMAHHAWETPFVREYVFEERRPDFAHVHGGWKKKAGMHRQAAFRKGYVEIPGYPTGKTYRHIGNHVRKDLFVKPTWDGDRSRATAFGGMVGLEGLEVPAPEVAAGESLYVRLGWRGLLARTHDFRAWLFLSGQGRLLVWELPPGYDWYPTKSWRRDEVILGRHTLPLPSDLPPGDYALGLVVTGREGKVLPSNASASPAVYAGGEVRWDGAITVVPVAEAVARTEALRDEALAEAAAGRCSAAEERLEVGRRHLSPDHLAQPRGRAEVIAALARCWALVAEQAVGEAVEAADLEAGAGAPPRASDPDALAEQAILAARRWDHRHPDVERVGQRLADRWQAQGEATDDIEAAYRALSRALKADPTRSWLRRRAEALRDERLGIDEADPEEDEA